MTPAPRPELRLPMAFAAMLLGATLLLIALDLPRLAIASLALSLAVVLAVLRDIIPFGDR